MLCSVKSYFFHIFILVYFVHDHLRVFAHQKRSDIDLQVCLENFNVKLDEIIRTQDSQQLGAKYLNEVDLGSREECLRLCCETEECDVFVFEEKKSGSCYLFHCGPPEKFKCKFTHHANYSSAMLSINRHLTDLESQMRHEQDLTNLRKQEKETIMFKPMLMQSQKQQTTTTTVKPLPLVYPKLNVSVRKCRRFQFECRSTSECIAIYNACDGIPQCADGSDEAPELGCPSNLITSAPPLPTAMNRPPEFNKYDNKVPLGFIPHENILEKPIYQHQMQRELPNIPQLLPKTDPNFIRPNEEANMNYRIRYNMELPPQYPPIQSAIDWIPQPQPNPVVSQVHHQNVAQPPHIEAKAEVEQTKHVEKIIHVKHKSESHHAHQDDYPNVAYYHDPNDLQDGISKTPSGAILSVAVGMTITAIMAVMFGCRLKMVRRRIRKDGKAYTHDADFLVNGMYL